MKRDCIYNIDKLFQKKGFRSFIYLYYKSFDIHKVSVRLAHFTHSASIISNRKIQRSLIRGRGTSIHTTLDKRLHGIQAEIIFFHKIYRQMQFYTMNDTFLDGYVPYFPFYVVYILHLIRFARISSNVSDFKNRIQFSTAYLGKQGY